MRRVACPLHQLVRGSAVERVFRLTSPRRFFASVLKEAPHRHQAAPAAEHSSARRGMATGAIAIPTVSLNTTPSAPSTASASNTSTASTSSRYAGDRANPHAFFMDPGRLSARERFYEKFFAFLPFASLSVLVATPFLVLKFVEDRKAKTTVAGAASASGKELLAAPGPATPATTSVEVTASSTSTPAQELQPPSIASKGGGDATATAEGADDHAAITTNTATPRSLPLEEISLSHMVDVIHGSEVGYPTVVFLYSTRSWHASMVRKLLQDVKGLLASAPRGSTFRNVRFVALDVTSGGKNAEQLAQEAATPSASTTRTTSSRLTASSTRPAAPTDQREDFEDYGSTEYPPEPEDCGVQVQGAAPQRSSSFLDEYPPMCGPFLQLIRDGDVLDYDSEFTATAVVSWILKNVDLEGKQEEARENLLVAAYGNVERTLEEYRDKLFEESFLP